jgi:hypothetical protein
LRIAASSEASDGGSVGCLLLPLPLNMHSLLRLLLLLLSCIPPIFTIISCSLRGSLYYHQPLPFIPSEPFYSPVPFRSPVLFSLSTFPYYYYNPCHHLYRNCDGDLPQISIHRKRFPTRIFLGQRRRMLVSRLVHAHFLVLPNPIRVEGSHGPVFCSWCAATHTAAPGEMSEVRAQVQATCCCHSTSRPLITTALVNHYYTTAAITTSSIYLCFRCTYSALSPLDCDILFERLTLLLPSTIIYQHPFMNCYYQLWTTTVNYHLPLLIELHIPPGSTMLL